MSGFLAVDLLGYDGNLIAQCSIKAPFRIPIGDVTIKECTPTRLVLSLRRRGGGFFRSDNDEDFADAPIGSVPILSTRADGQGFEVVPLTLSPPAPITAIDVDEMWRAASRLPASVAQSVRRDGVSPAKVSIGGPGLYLDPVPQLVTLARHATNHWPSIECSELGWRRVDLPGGIEDVRGTLAKPLRSGFARVNDQLVMPERTLRRRTAIERWRLDGLSAVAEQLVLRLSDGKQRDDRLLQALAPLSMVAHLASREHGGTDVPVSSWPAILRRLYELCLVVLAGVSAAGIGTDRAPLSHLWELYEAWVSAVVLEVLTDMFGQPTTTPLGLNSQGRPAWKANWRTGDRLVELYGQAEFGSSKLNHGLAVRSVSAALIPDCLVVSNRNGLQRMVAIDAKFRGQKTMTAGDLNQAASPYLWSLRHADLAEEHALEHFLVVASGSVSKVYFPSVAKTTAVTGTPQLADQLRGRLMELLGP